MSDLTITLEGSEVRADFFGTNAWLRNDGTSTIYAGRKPDVVSGADGVVSVPAGGSAPVFDAHGTVYIIGTGSVQLIGSDYSNNPFKTSAQGGSGADEVARAAIEAHAGNSAIHLTAEQINSIDGGKTVEKAAAYTLDNAVDYPLVDMRIYGKSTQDGVPSPENPVDIVSVGDSGAVGVTACGKNLLDVKNPAYIRGSVVDAIDGATTTLENNGMTLKSGATNSTWVANRWFYKIKKGTYTISCKISCDDETFTPKLGIYFMSTMGDKSLYCSELNPSKLVVTYNFQEDGYIGLYFHLTDDNGITASSRTVRYYDIQIELGDTATTYEPYIGSTATLTSAIPLCGIPVSEGGNYTDSNGQQWICDELVYNADGTGKIIKRVAEIQLTDNCGPYNSNDIGSIKFQGFSVKGDNTIICSHLNYQDKGRLYHANAIGISGNPQYNQIVANFGLGNLESTKEFLSNNNVTACYALASPQEIPLTAAEMAQLQQLQTFDGITNISNDGGADMQIKYCTNKALSEYEKPVIDGLKKQIDELKTAVLSLGGNV